jgi:hypothetical protein
LRPTRSYIVVMVVTRLIIRVKTGRRYATTSGSLSGSPMATIVAERVFTLLK